MSGSFPWPSGPVPASSLPAPVPALQLWPHGPAGSFLAVLCSFLYRGQSASSHRLLPSQGWLLLPVSVARDITPQEAFLTPCPRLKCQSLTGQQGEAALGWAGGWVRVPGGPLPMYPQLFVMPGFSWTPHALLAATSSAGWWPGSTSASLTSQA